MDPTTFTVSALHAALTARQVTAVQVVQAHLERLARLNGHLNAVVALNDRALDDAHAVDARRTGGAQLRLLEGVPVVIKDTIDVAGLPTTMGWAPLSAPAGGVALVPDVDAPVVARLRAAGAIVLGKTNVPAFAYDPTRTDTSWAGRTRNAVQPHLAPGASSAGTATAVAAGFALLGLAEETAGSILNPAGAQALVGVKPTFGRVPGEGVVPLAGSTRDVVGPHARTVRDAATALDVLMGAPHAAQTLALGGLRGRRLGLYGPGWKAAPLSEETQRLYARAQDHLRTLGAVLVPDPFRGSGLVDLGRTYPTTVGFESVAADLHRYLARYGPGAPVRSLPALRRLGDPFGPGGVLEDLHDRVAASLADPDAPPDLTAFRAARAAYVRVMGAVMDAHALDALVFPQRTADLPPLNGEADIEATTVSEVNIAGWPAVTAPAGAHASGAPFALVWVGRARTEAALLRLAYAYEQSGPPG
ncbi:amidase [Deinococcus maricopensis]|uniref:Amidase n=1 Tax=Deinococcus maricopensis (strain DSM 21211 / LMG 22137 / NRRL B-23946 / LB-34) TaxID=709986 RepID=E8U4D3_DEIML|nr:amidase [Deinococcus maricopensis]ADV65970.1 Amidase [Deinococcus maricopensis DSM 21211]